MGSKFQIYMAAEAAADNKSTIAVIKRIRSSEGDTWFSFPDDFQRLSCHEALMKLPPMISAKNALKGRGHFRTINVTLSDTLQKTYVDADGNFIFKEHFLAETRWDSSDSQLNSSISPGPSESKEESVKDILKHFLVDKFSSRNRNVSAWCDLFEKESLRFSLTGQKQIEVFKSCLESTMCDWFAVSQRKFGINADWSIWRADLIATFGDTSWKPIRYAFNFKY